MDGYIGTIMMFAGTYAPQNWAFCHGQLLQIAQYQALYSIVGTYYGGDGRTNFALPDLRGRAPIGQGQAPGLSWINLGEKGGSETVTQTVQNMPAHTHAARLHAETSKANQSNPQGRMLAFPQPDGTMIYSDSDPSINNRVMNAASIVENTVGGSQPMPIRSATPGR